MLSFGLFVLVSGTSVMIVTRLDIMMIGSLLDLEQVGVGQGVSTADLCRRLSDRFPALRLITGGGVRTIRDVLELATTGAEAVLVASSLHNGVIGDEELSALNRV